MSEGNAHDEILWRRFDDLNLSLSSLRIDHERLDSNVQARLDANEKAMAAQLTVLTRLEAELLSNSKYLSELTGAAKTMKLAMSAVVVLIAILTYFAAQ